MRTWGGVVGIRGDKMFVDFGLSTQPEYAWWETETGWSIENVGVEPDIKVELTPDVYWSRLRFPFMISAERLTFSTASCCSLVCIFICSRIILEPFLIKLQS
jgi:tricorn protease